MPRGYAYLISERDTQRGSEYRLMPFLKQKQRGSGLGIGGGGNKRGGEKGLGVEEGGETVAGM